MIDKLTIAFEAKDNQSGQFEIVIKAKYCEEEEITRKRKNFNKNDTRKKRQVFSLKSFCNFNYQLITRIISQDIER